MRQVAAVFAFALLFTAVTVYAQEAFLPDCELPYARIAHKQPIDALCPAYGRAARTSPPAMEFRAKNNLCARAPAATVTLADFIALQPLPERAGIPTGDPRVYVPNRELLKNIFTTNGGQTIGEGALVRMVAYVSHATYSDTSKGENVNCNQTGNEPNDIHISVVAATEMKPCDGIVAEMIPHYRPTAWTPGALNRLGARPVRITGHLFFDSRHRISTCALPSSPPVRVSLWEIHPVYALDVCRSSTLRACEIANEAMWIPLDQWRSR